MLLLGVVALNALLLSALLFAQRPAQTPVFEKDILPILKANCLMCHSGSGAQGENLCVGAFLASQRWQVGQKHSAWCFGKKLTPGKSGFWGPCHPEKRNHPNPRLSF